jgi:LCP family protein required for cell wall assembly
MAPIVPVKKRSLGRSIFWSLIFLLTATASATVGTTLALILPIPGAADSAQGQKLLGDLWKNGFQFSVSRPVNILIMGIDQVPGAKEGTDGIFAGRSDTMLLLRVDPTDNSVNLLSIPRDTQVEIPGIGVTKINQANASGGPLLARETLRKTLNVDIDRYVRVSTGAFRELVDALGGVRVYVPQRMKYTDKTQKLTIDLEPGWQDLNGDQAEQFARFRHDSYGDIGRVQRQQTLIKALREKLTNPLMLPRLPVLVGTLQKYIDTNLTVEEMLALLTFGIKLDQGNFKQVLLPGRFSAPNEYRASYWIVDPKGRDRVMQEYFKNQSSSAAGEESSSSLRIAVQNASSDPDAVKEFMSYLVALGYSNVYQLPDWKDEQPKTQVIVQRGDLIAAKALQQSLKFGKVEATSTGDLESDLTIRIGDDWNTEKAKLNLK